MTGCKCRFRVLTEEGKYVIAENVVKAFYEGKTLKLVNILNEVVTIENAMISEVDLNRGELRILENQILGEVLEFLRTYTYCLNKSIYDSSVEELWNRVKSLGELMIRELWVRSRRVRR